MVSEGATRRVLDRAKGRRRLGPQEPGWEEAEVVRLGGESLHLLADLLGDPSLVESLRLYLGSGVASIVLLRRPLRGAVEEYVLDTEGRLVYRWRDTRWDMPDGEMQESRSTVLSKASDFRGLSLDSVARLQGEVSSGNLWERLAWRMGRDGKPGYREGGYLEESETWRYLSADPEEVPEMARRTHSARRVARRARE